VDELEVFDSQMMRIYKKELEDLVMSYEGYIQAIYRQLEKRQGQYHHSNNKLYAGVQMSNR